MSAVFLFRWWDLSSCSMSDGFKIGNASYMPHRDRNETFSLSHSDEHGSTRSSQRNR